MPWGPFGRTPQYNEGPPKAAPPSPIEDQFWAAYQRLQPRELRGLVRQYKVGPFKLDFAVPKYKFSIELDGYRDHSNTTDVANDHRRTRYLQARGWFEVRFGGQDVVRDPESCVREAAMLFRVYRRHR